MVKGNQSLFIIISLIFLISLASPAMAVGDYYGPAAVKYAQIYVSRMCDCGISYAPPTSGGDCTHFVSHCLEAGGISNRGSHYATNWLENPGLIVSVDSLRKWFLETGVATQVNSITDLEPGDVILYMPTSSGSNHATLYIGSNQVASHTSNGFFYYTYFGKPQFWKINGRKSFSKGDMVEVENSYSSGLTVRDSPAGNSIAKKFDHTQGIIIEDNPTPELLQSDAKVYIWWKIQWSDDGLVGWSAQSYPGRDYYLKKITTQTGSLAITSTPPGATVFIDNVNRGMTPSNGALQINNIQGGTHNLRLSKTNYQDYSTSVTVITGATTPYTFSLTPVQQPQTGSLAITIVARRCLYIRGRYFPRSNSGISPTSY